MRERKYNLRNIQEQRNNWHPVCIENLSEEQKKEFLSKKMAVDMYIDGFMLKEITQKTNIAQSMIARLVQRCITVDSKTGSPFGYQALLPYIRVNIESSCFNRKRTDKTKGSFNMLLLTHPTLPVFIENTYFNLDKSSSEKNIPRIMLHKKFLEECRKIGIQDYEYPFNTSDLAQRTFYKYLSKLENLKVNNAISRQSENAKKKFFSTGVADKMRPPALAPFSLVQIDGHKIDMLYTVEVREPNGEVVYLPAGRAWLIAIIDVATRTILGYSLTAEENYNQTDVLKAVRNAILPRKPISFSLPGLSYPQNGGYPSSAIPITEWALFDTIMLDNAKAHLTKNVIEKLCDELHCSLNYGAVATPEVRGIIERVFKTIEEKGYHRMPSTTGSNICDTRRTDAEKNAIRYNIRYNDIVQLTEYLIVSYNNTPHSSLNNQTPLECMKRRIEAGMEPCIANDATKEKVFSITNFYEEKTIRGNMEQGRRPYIRYKGVDYRNDILSQSMGLINQKLIIEINPDNIRTLKGYFSNGTPLGILMATGEWGRKDHSLKTRQDVMKWSNSNKNINRLTQDALSEYQEELMKRSKKERRSRTKSARITEEQTNIQAHENFDTNINVQNPHPKSNDMNIEENTIKKKMEAYTPEEIQAILDAGSVEEAYNQGLI